MLVPHGTGHRILSDPDAPSQDLWSIPRVEETDRYDRMQIHGGGEPAGLICGAVSFVAPGLGRLLHLPCSIPANTLHTFFISYAASRCRSALVGICLHSVQTVVFTVILLVLVLR